MANDTVNGKPWIPPTPDVNHTLYQVVANRRCSYDSMLWSTPVISLAGLAFLFNIALSPDTAEWPRRFASFLAVCFALASAHLLYKHRYGERNDSDWLEAYEKEHLSCQAVHGKRGTAQQSPSGWTMERLSAYWIWQGLLIVFFGAAFVVLFLACSNPDWFKATG